MREVFRQLGIKNETGIIHSNLSQAALIEKSLTMGQGHLSQDGALVVNTGKHTGRAAKDKYVVMDEISKEKLWWNKDVREMSTDVFRKIKQDVLNYLSQGQDLFVTEKSVGAEEKFSLGVRVISPSPYHILFSNNMFRDAISSYRDDRDFTVLHAPAFVVDPAQYDTRSETVIVTNFKERIVLVLGTHYAGEIKKSIFSIMNFILPDAHVLPMHSGANIGHQQDVSIFFGLSGTGKTTLSTDIGRKLIGDDEHGLNDKGVFNFEGGCYAKTYKLSLETEPGIFQACNRFGSLLENVVMDKDTRIVDFFDKSLAENTRGSYPLTFIDDFEESARGPVPKHMFFLSADAFGVLPPVSKLNRQQAMYYFLSGYTAKVAGTEMGVVEPTAAFSTCFGAPFMMRKPQLYGELLGELLDKLPTQVWLINTGWSGGGYGVGERFPLKVTRTIIRAIQEGKLDQAKFETDKIFGVAVPTEVPGVDKKMLRPELTWPNANDYESAAKKLALMFHKNMELYSSDPAIKQGGPHYRG